MLKVFAVRDVKADAFGGLLLETTAGLATRSFATWCNNRESPINAHPEDYSLYELGSYDPNSGVMKSLHLPLLVCSAVSLIVKPEISIRASQSEVVS